MPGNSKLRSQALICLGVLMVVSAAATAAEPVAFTFAWPAGLSADVRFSAKQARVMGKRQSSQIIDGTYTMQTAAVEDGLQVKFGAFDIKMPAADNPVSTAVQHFMGTLGATIPNFVASSDAKLVRLDGITELRRNAIADFDALSDKLSPDGRKRLDKVMNGLLSNARLKGSIESYWQRDVGAWHGKVFTPGTFEVSTREQPVKMLQDAMFPMKESTGLVDMRPCSDGMAMDSCAMLEVKTDLRSGDLSPEAAEKLRGFLRNAPADVKFKSLRIRTLLSVLTEPKTLLPHSIKTSREMVVVLVSGDGSEINSKQKEVRETHYIYK